ncbi:MAG: DUF1679 domain-containing protein [Actinobacteria bacterium]|nr:DUF1679 domain-containing protein [Actinomycetota bacterium]
MKADRISRLQNSLSFAFYTLTIFVEDHFSFMIPISFNRSTDDLKKNPAKLIDSIKDSLSIGEVESFDTYSVIREERGKDQFITGLKLTYLDGDSSSRTEDIIVKFLSLKNEPLVLNALKSALYSGLNREVEFYKSLSEKIPLVTAGCLYTHSIPALYRAVIVMESLHPDHRVDDYIGCTAEQTKAVLSNIAKMHAKFWGRVFEDPSLDWIPDQHAVGYLWFLDYITKKEAVCKQLWAALYKYFTGHPLTVGHGDCRPGNIMWYDDGSIALVDWQFANASLGTWDASYCIVMSTDVEIRRKHEEEMMNYYYDNLSASYNEYHSEELPYSRAQCLEDHHLLKLVLALYGWGALVTHMFDRYGNDPRDVRAWADRITAAVTDLDSDFVSSKLNIPASVMDDFKKIMSDARDMTKERFVESGQ